MRQLAMEKNRELEQEIEVRKSLEGKLEKQAERLRENQCPLETEAAEHKRANEAVQEEQTLRLLAFQSAERKLIAYEIHDGLVQLVTGEMSLQAWQQSRTATARKPERCSTEGSNG